MGKYWELYSSFFKIGLFTFGGGYAMISIIQQEVITNRGWIEEREPPALYRSIQLSLSDIKCMAIAEHCRLLRGLSRHRLS